MEFLNQSLIFLFLASFIFISFICLLFKSSNPTSNLPPGPWKLPLIGNLHNFIGALPHHSLHRLAKIHGPLIHLKLGELSFVIVSSKEVAKQVLKTQDPTFASRPPTSAAEILGYETTDLGCAPYGEYWRQVRKICVMEVFTQRRVQSFRFIREDVFLGMIKWVASNEGSPLNLTEKIQSSTCEVVSRSTLGDVTKENELLLPIFNGAVELASGFDVADLFPSVGLLRRFSRTRLRFHKYRHELDIILDKIIYEHRGGDKAPNGKERHQDFVDVLLKHQDEETDFPLSTDNIKAIILNVFIAGIETSSTTLIWALSEMMKKPEILDRTQQEVRQVFDPKCYVDESEMNQLKYLNCVIKESLRLHPPLPLIPRESTRKCEINGYDIPIGTKVLVNAWTINNDPHSWKDPHCFQPERFLDTTVDYMGNSFEYIPFGGGRRMCPGIHFGLANVHLPLAMLLYYFDWTLPKGMKPVEMDMSDGFGLTVPRKKPLVIVPTLGRVPPDSTTKRVMSVI